MARPQTRMSLVFTATLLLSQLSAIFGAESEFTLRCKNCFCKIDDGYACPAYDQNGIRDYDDYDVVVSDAYASFKLEQDKIPTLESEDKKPCFPFLNAKYKDSEFKDADLPKCVDPEAAKLENVCAFKYEKHIKEKAPKKCMKREYEFKTYATETAALQDKAVLTHTGACGVCSTAQDLAIMMEFGEQIYRRIAACIKEKEKELKPYLEGKAANAADAVKKIQENCKVISEMSGPCALLYFYKVAVETKVCANICPDRIYVNSTDKTNTKLVNDETCEDTECRYCLQNATMAQFEKFAGRTFANSGLTGIYVQRCEQISNVTQDPCKNAAGALKLSAGIAIGIVGFLVWNLGIM